MDKERLKLIIRNIESLVDCLKSEVCSDDPSHTPKDTRYEEITSHIHDYDEIFYDDDGYSD